MLTLTFNTRYVFMFLNEYFLTHLVKCPVYYLEIFSPFPWMDISYFSLPISPPPPFAVFFVFFFYIFFLFKLSFQGSSVSIMLLSHL